MLVGGLQYVGGKCETKRSVADVKTILSRVNGCYWQLREVLENCNYGMWLISLGNGPDWLFDVDSLTISMNYVPVVAGNQTNGIAGTRDNIVAGQAEKKIEPEQEYIWILSAYLIINLSRSKDMWKRCGMKLTEVI
ncbi:hypothetical protein Tco_0013817 [Tanacetum coccineum]